jgi:hypothetical protein
MSESLKWQDAGVQCQLSTEVTWRNGELIQNEFMLLFLCQSAFQGAMLHLLLV